MEPKENNSAEIVEPSKCSRCVMFENSISNFANLYYQEQDQVKEQKRVNFQLERKVKELEKQLKKYGIPK